MSAPRQLDSLACAEARDGTVWRDSDRHRWLHRYSEGQWWWKRPSAFSWQPYRYTTGDLLHGILTECGPYTAIAQQSADDG